MGDFFALLNELTNTAAEMEFCEDFNKLQLILNNINQFVRSFDKIVCDSGNEPYIIEVVARLLRYLRVQNYLDTENKVNRPYEPQLRRITLYMMLNTDVSFRYDLEQDARINHLLKSLPQLTKCLLMNCIWGLDLDRFLYEMLRYAPLWFSMQYIDQAILSLRCAKPYEVLERIESMVSSIYFAICRTDRDWRRIDRNRYVDQQRTLGRMFDFIADMLCFLNTPNLTKFEGWSRLRKHRYFGFVLKHMFSMTMACLDMYFRRPAIPVDPAMSVYELMDDRHVAKPAPDKYSSATETILLKINHCLLNTLEACVMDVSIERFCYWVEIDLFTEGEETITLQQVIGESAYRLCEDLKTHRHFRHSIVRHLTQFALRPKTLAEKAAGMTIGMLMRRIDSATTDDERSVFLTEFLRRSELVLDNEECLAKLEKHFHHLNEANVRAMIEYDTREPIGDELMDDDDGAITDERMKLRELILRVVDILPVDDFHRLVCFTIETFGTEFCRYRQPELLPAVIRTINRLRGDTTSDHQPATPTIQGLLFQAPAIFFGRLIRTLHDPDGGFTPCETYVDTIVAFLMRHQPIAKVFMREPLVAYVVRGESLGRSPMFSYLVRRLFEVRLYAPDEFIDRFLLDGFDQQCGVRDRKVLYELLRLYVSFGASYFESDEKESAANRLTLMKRAVGRLADVIGHMRYVVPLPADTDDTEPDQTTVIAFAIEQLVATLNKLQRQATDEDKKIMLKDAAVERLLSTQYYFRKHLTITAPTPANDEPAAGLTNGTESDVAPPTSFAVFMYRNALSSPAEKQQIQEFLLELYPQCTEMEAIDLARDKLLGPHIPDVVAIAQQRLLENPNHRGCLRNCIGNYVQCLLQVYLPDAVLDGLRADEACADAIRTVTDHLRQVPEATRESVCNGLSPALVTLYRYVRDVAPAVKRMDLLEQWLFHEPGIGDDVAAAMDTENLPLETKE